MIPLKRRLASVLLVACLVVGLLPTSALAADTNAATEGYIINYAEETITISEGYEVYTAQTGSTKIESNSKITDYIGQSLYIRQTEPESSTWTTISVPARPETPNLTIDTRQEGVEVPEGYRYNTSSQAIDAEGWTGGTGTLVRVQPQATIYIYKAAVTEGDNPSFRSDVQTLTAPARATTPSGGAPPSLSVQNEVINFTSPPGQSISWQYRVDSSDISDPNAWSEATFPLALSKLGWTGETSITVNFRVANDADSYAGNPTDAMNVGMRPPAPTSNPAPQSQFPMLPKIRNTDYIFRRKAPGLGES